MDARDEVKSRLPIEDVIASYIDLKKAGRNFKGLSPFTHEKTASFIVSPEKQIWHDFSSGKGGDVFSFVMEVEGLDFRGALELLARRAGIDLEQYEQPSKSAVGKNRLYSLLELATKFYQTQLTNSQEAVDYIFVKRAITKPMALAFKLGYSPNTGDALVSFVKKRGYSEKEAQLAGLTTERRSQTTDMFRGRLMIPLSDSQGRVIGYTARQLIDDPKAPKYINTPQTILYDKSRHIYGLDEAKEAIRKTGFGVIVEGNLDVVASHQIGVKQVVATAGTALTEYHLKGLSMLTGDIRLCFDTDRAGLAATERAISLASKLNLNLSVITVPDSKDADELIKKQPKLWLAAVEAPTYAIDWLINFYRSQLDLSSPQGKRRLSDLVLPIVRSLSDDVERDHYVNQLAKLLSVSTDAISAKLVKVARPTGQVKHRIKPLGEIDMLAVERQKIQDNFLAIMLIERRLRRHLELIDEPMMIDDNGRQLLKILKTQPNVNVKADLKDFKDITDYVKIEILLYEELYAGLDTLELAYEAARLQARLVETYTKKQKAEITRKLKVADDKTTRELLKKAKQLDRLLNQVNGEAMTYAQETTT